MVSNCHLDYVTSLWIKPLIMRYFIKSIENLHPLGIYSDGISSQLLLYTSYCLYRIIKVLRYVATHHNPTFNLLKAYLSFLILQHMSGSMISEFFPFFQNKTKYSAIQTEEFFKFFKWKSRSQQIFLCIYFLELLHNTAKKST